MRVSRRRFLGLAGVAAGAAVGATFPQALLGDLPPAQAAEESLPLVKGERQVASTCALCDARCGIIARVVDGRVIKLEGNILAPHNLGRLCPKGQAGLQVLYDPDRLRWPLRRVGARGSGKWERVSWPQALTQVAEHLGDLRARGLAHTVVFQAGNGSHFVEGLIERFMTAYGSPNLVHQHHLGAAATILANYFSQGVRDFVNYDLANDNYVLSFGASFLEAWRHTVETQRLLGEMRRGRPGLRAKIVQIDPRYSVSASKADEWLPIRPGSDGALALALAHVIIAEELYDQDFIRNHTFGFEDWRDEGGRAHLGFKTLVLRDYAPERVEALTGIPAGTITKLAREFATNPPAVAISGRGGESQTNGLYNRMAIHSLNALVGSFDRPGGILTESMPPFTPWRPPVLDATARAGGGQPRLDGAGSLHLPFATDMSQALPEAILRGEPYPAQAMFFYYTNPLFSRPQAQLYREALDRVPFVVSFSPFMDESTAQADLVLPDTTYLERWDVETPPCSDGCAVLGLRQPVVAPLYDAASTGEVMVRLAHEMGGTIGESFPWGSYLEALQESCAGVFLAKRGTLQFPTWEEFWGELKAQGIWWDAPPLPPAGGPKFATPSGKFEFYSQALEMGLRESLARSGSASSMGLERYLETLGVQARGDEAFLPHYEPGLRAGEEAEYPLTLVTFKTMTGSGSRMANVPFMLEIYGLHVRKRWQSWVEINPETARRLGVRDGDQVWVESLVGRIKTVAKLYEGAMPEAVNMPYGFGHREGGHWSRGRGANPNELLPNIYSPLGGNSSWSGTRVKVYRA